MLTAEALRVMASANETLELRKAYIQSIRDRIDRVPRNSEEERALMAEFVEFDLAFINLFTKSAKPEPLFHG